MSDQIYGIDRSSDRQQFAEQSKFINRKYFGGGKKYKKTSIYSLIITPVNQKKGSTKLKKWNHTTRRE